MALPGNNHPAHHDRHGIIGGGPNEHADFGNPDKPDGFGSSDTVHLAAGNPGFGHPDIAGPGAGNASTDRQGKRAGFDGPNVGNAGKRGDSRGRGGPTGDRR